MSGPAEQLRRLHEAGFILLTFDRYPRAVGVARGDCIALCDVTPSGLSIVGTPGWRMGEVMGVLVGRNGRQFFQAKSQVLEATPERLADLSRFRSDLEQVLLPEA